jgi:7,8-dihydro-6-hydroxymethylpterin dimethyltransferase
MDACSLDAERIDACVFMAITQDGPISMCAYNAQRDRWLLQPLRIAQGGVWQPLLGDAGHAGSTVVIPLKHLKGRAREAALRARERRRNIIGVSP